MKKKIIFVLITFLVGMLFAKDFTVIGVTGKVQFEQTPEVWKDVSKGNVLTSSTVINTGLNSKLVLKSENETFVIKPMQKGTIEKLILNPGIAKGKLNVTKGETAHYETVKSKGISTASSRASEAKEDLEWEE